MTRSAVRGVPREHPVVFFQTSMLGGIQKAYDSGSKLDTMWNDSANDVFNKAFADATLVMNELCTTIQSLINFMVNVAKKY